MSDGGIDVTAHEDKVAFRIAQADGENTFFLMSPQDAITLAKKTIYAAEEATEVVKFNNIASKL